MSEVMLACPDCGSDNVHIVIGEVSGQAIFAEDDVDTDEAYDLSEGEKREAIGRFIQGYACKTADWLAIDAHARDVLAERHLHGRV